jgi:uncharacterized protein YidB (DUF937 family)
MGLFDQVVGALSGGNQAGGNNALLEAALHLVNNPQTGGLGGLIQSLQQGGLGEIVNSWVSTGQNMPVSGGQLGSALGGSTLQGLAEKLGMSPDQVSGGLAAVLPQVIDHLTPHGEVPQNGDLMTHGLDLLKGKLFA